LHKYQYIQTKSVNVNDIYLLTANEDAEGGLLAYKCYDKKSPCQDRELILRDKPSALTSKDVATSSINFHLEHDSTACAYTSVTTASGALISKDPLCTTNVNNQIYVALQTNGNFIIYDIWKGQIKPYEPETTEVKTISQSGCTVNNNWCGKGR